MRSAEGRQSTRRRLDWPVSARLNAMRRLSTMMALWSWVQKFDDWEIFCFMVGSRIRTPSIPSRNSHLTQRKPNTMDIVRFPLSEQQPGELGICHERDARSKGCLKLMQRCHVVVRVADVISKQCICRSRHAQTTLISQTPFLNIFTAFS